MMCLQVEGLVPAHYVHSGLRPLVIRTSMVVCLLWCMGDWLIDAVHVLSL